MQNGQDLLRGSGRLGHLPGHFRHQGHRGISFDAIFSKHKSVIYPFGLIYLIEQALCQSRQIVFKPLF
jgi:hypothetical protein